MKQLKTCLESALEVTEPPKPEKDKSYVVMQGPLSTVFALTLMKKHSIPQDGDITTNDVQVQKENKSEQDTVNTPAPEQSTFAASTSNDPPSLSMEMQMSFIDNAMTRVEIENEISAAEINEGQERFKQYYQTALKSNYVYLDK